MPTEFYHPRFWPTWLGVGLLRLLILLPWTWQMGLGKGAGLLLYRLLPSRRTISCINLEIAFPELSKQEIVELNRKHFINLGQGAIESALGWWGSDAQIRSISHVENFEFIEETLKKDNVILLGAHFASLEVGGRIMAHRMPLHVTYRPHQNALIDYLVARQRDIKYGKAIPKRNIRDMIKSIKQRSPTWYATDQNYRGKGSLMVPFFGVDAPTNPGTSRLVKITGAKVIPSISVRLIGEKDQKRGYLIRFLAPIEDFPTGDVYEDTARLNAILEDFIREFPEQYLWTHKRYKHYKSKNKDFYEDYKQANLNSACHL